jgi:hypothetical protein
MIDIKNEIVVDTIRPEWLRREIAEAVVNGNDIKIQISNGNVFDREYYVKLVDRRKLKERGYG